MTSWQMSTNSNIKRRTRHISLPGMVVVSFIACLVVLFTGCAPKCSTCGGDGYHPTGKTACKRCDAKGVVPTGKSRQNPCGPCNGTGSVRVVEPCGPCNGTGSVRITEPDNTPRWKMRTCPQCSGQGRISGTDGKKKTCPRCNGQLTIRVPDTTPRTTSKTVPCRPCGGSGKLTKTSVCRACGGSGKVTLSESEKCPQCDGDKYECPRCNGSGHL